MDKKLKPVQKRLIKNFKKYFGNVEISQDEKGVTYQILVRDIIKLYECKRKMKFKLYFNGRKVMECDEIEKIQNVITGMVNLKWGKIFDKEFFYKIYKKGFLISKNNKIIETYKDLKS